MSSVIAVGLACVGCEGEQATTGYSCPEWFEAVLVFDPGAAQQFVVELCTGSDCVSAEASPDSVQLETPGFFQWVRFSAGTDQLGETYASARAKPRDPLSAGEVHTHTLTVRDADTSAVLTSHTEAVTYELVTVTAETNQCVHGEFSFPDGGDAGD